jgi:hypothetical protein
MHVQSLQAAVATTIATVTDTANAGNLFVAEV